MQIVDYDSKRGELFVRYNTNNVWRYSKITEEMYNDLKSCESPRDFLRKLFHKINTVGVIKEDSQ